MTDATTGDRAGGGGPAGRPAGWPGDGAGWSTGRPGNWPGDEAGWSTGWSTGGTGWSTGDARTTGGAGEPMVDERAALPGPTRDRAAHRYPSEPAGLASLQQRHAPTRPAWTCACDGRPWPCTAARVHLRSQYAGDQVGLSIYMSGQLMTAAVDLADDHGLPPDLFQRFVAWT